MSQTLTISDELYSRLEAEARAKSAKSIEELLEQTHLGMRQIGEDELRLREKAVTETIALQERLSKTMGMMPDGVDLIREDRDR